MVHTHGSCVLYTDLCIIYLYVSLHLPTYLMTLSPYSSLSLLSTALIFNTLEVPPLVYMFTCPNVAEEARFSVIHLTSGIPTSLLQCRD